MNYSDSNYQIGQSLHQEYQSKYSSSADFENNATGKSTSFPMIGYALAALAIALLPILLTAV